MNNLRLLCATALLIFAMTFSVSAGNIECDAIGNPPPLLTTAPGDIECDGLQLAVSLIESMLCLS
jgi:hypothetical protein